MKLARDLDAALRGSAAHRPGLQVVQRGGQRGDHGPGRPRARAGRRALLAAPRPRRDPRRLPRSGARLPRLRLRRARRPAPGPGELLVPPRLPAARQGAGFSQGVERSFHYGYLAPDAGHPPRRHDQPPGRDDPGRRRLRLRRASCDGSGRVAINFIGEGGTSTGDFHEGLNIAAVWKLPLVLVIENNRYAFSTPAQLQYACPQLSDRGPGYGIAAETVDGNDPDAMAAALARAVARARGGERADAARGDARPHARPRRGGRLAEGGAAGASSSATVAEPTRCPPTPRRARGRRASSTAERRAASRERAGRTRSTELGSTRSPVRRRRALGGRRAAAATAATRRLGCADVFAPAPLGRGAPTPWRLHRRRRGERRRARSPTSTPSTRRCARRWRDDPASCCWARTSAPSRAPSASPAGSTRAGRTACSTRRSPRAARSASPLGAALLGYRPVVEMQFGDFVSCGFNQIVNVAAKLYYRLAAPLPDRRPPAPRAAASAPGPSTRRTPRPGSTHVAGLKVVCPATARRRQGPAQGGASATPTR